MNINVLENQEICAVYFAKSMKYAKITLHNFVFKIAIV